MARPSSPRWRCTGWSPNCRTTRSTRSRPASPTASPSSRSMLRSEHERITAHMERCCRRSRRTWRASTASPPTCPVTSSTRSPRSTASSTSTSSTAPTRCSRPTWPTDMNLVFPKGEFRVFLDSVFGADKVMNDGIDLSPGHGHAQDLQLLRPQGQRLHHRDLDRRSHQPRRQRLRLDEQVLLRGFLHRSRPRAPQLKNVDIYLINAAGTWSLLTPARSSIRRWPNAWPRIIAAGASGRRALPHTTAASRPRRRPTTTTRCRPSSSSARSPMMSAWRGRPSSRSS